MMSLTWFTIKIEEFEFLRIKNWLDYNCCFCWAKLIENNNRQNWRREGGRRRNYTERFTGRCRPRKVDLPLPLVPVSSTKQVTEVAEECLISRNTSSSGASAPRWRIGRCAKRKPCGDGCENERSQVRFERYIRLSWANFSS